MRTTTKLAIGAALALLGCTAAQEGLPPGAKDADAFPASAYAVDFNMQEDLRAATRACVASELKGPVNLASLKQQGFVLYSELGRTGYMKAEPRDGKALLDKTSGIRVDDPSSRLSCTVSVFRNEGYTALAIISDEMGRLGYLRQQSGHLVRFVGHGHRFIVDGNTSIYDAWAHIRVYRIDPKDDKTCKKTKLTPAFRQYCS